MRSPPSFFFHGALAYEQPERGVGFRAGIDALLLARAALDVSARRVVDLGAGAGIVGLAIALHDASANVVLVERDGDAAACARRNAAAFGPRVTIAEHDVASVAHPADLVVSNPPYRRANEGAAAAIASVRAATRGDVAIFAAAAARCLGAGGRALFVYPSRAAPALVSAFADVGLASAALRFVHGSRLESARLVIASFVRGETNLCVGAPIFEDDADVAAFVAGSKAKAADRD